MLETTLPQEECVNRLKSKLRGMWEQNWTAEKPLYGTVSDSKFAVQLSPGEGRGVNPYHIRGVFLPSPAGTTIRATYGVEAAYRVFVAALASFFVLMLALIILRGSPSMWPLITGSVAILFVYLLWRLRSAGSYVDSLCEPTLRTVAEILEARVVEDPQASA